MGKKLVEIEVLVPTTYLIEVDQELDITDESNRPAMLKILLAQREDHREITNSCVDRTSEIVDAYESRLSDDIPEEYRNYQHESYNRFVRDMVAAGCVFEENYDSSEYDEYSKPNVIRQYGGRFGYQGPGVSVPQGNDCPNTTVSLRSDSLGLGMIYYPRY